MPLLSSTKLTVPIADFDNINIFAFKWERPKPQTLLNKLDIKRKELNQLHHMKQKLEPKKHGCTVDVNQNSK